MILVSVDMLIGLLVMIIESYNVYKAFVQSLTYSRLSVNVGFESKAYVIRSTNNPAL